MLDEIKKDLEWGVKVGGRPQENLDMEQVFWLIDQAEKLQKANELYFDGTLSDEELISKLFNIFGNKDN